MSSEKNEIDPNFKKFKYLVVPTTTEIFSEITVVIEFTIGRKDPRSFTGGTHTIIDNDAKKMEAESFFEAAEKAWKEQYKISSDPTVTEFVKKELHDKWKELNGEKLTNKTLDLK